MTRSNRARNRMAIGIRIALFIFVVHAAGMVAHAVPVTWTFQNITWGQEVISDNGGSGYPVVVSVVDNPGGSLTGSFSFDADQQIYQCQIRCVPFSTWNITVSAPGIPSFTLTPQNSQVAGWQNSSSPAGFSVTFVTYQGSGAIAGGGAIVTVYAYPALTDAGGTRSVGSTNPDAIGNVSVNAYHCGSQYCAPLGQQTDYDLYNSSQNSPIITTGQTGLAASTNLHADQLPGGNGTQIQLTWDYGTDSIDGFIIERQTPSERLAGTWEPPLSLTPSQGTPGHWYVIDTSATQYATYNYRVRAYKGTNESDNSNEAASFQLQLQTLRNNVQMLALFQPDVTTLDQVAQAFGYDHFNWLSELTYAPSSVTLSGRFEDIYGNTLNPPPPPIIDPPLGGWIYLPGDNLPYFWDEQSGFNPTYFLTQHMGLPLTLSH